MKNFIMFKLNKHTYIISGSTFVRPNWDREWQRTIKRRIDSEGYLA